MFRFFMRLLYCLFLHFFIPMTFFVALFVFLHFFYFIGLFFLIYFFKKMPYYQPTNFSQEVAIVVPVRNEAAHIADLLTDLSLQNYPTNLYTVYLIDDHSEDKTVQIAEKFLDKMRLKILKNKAFGKKSAIQTAIDCCEAELILTTDGDCRMGKNWLKTVVSVFENPQICLVSSPVVFSDKKSFFNKLLQIEFSSLVGVGAVSFFVHKAAFCNGANLAFRKSVFQKLNPYHDNLHLASGDDEFLMRKVAEYAPKGLFFLKNSDALVQTVAPKDIFSFLKQRIRWASKWKNTGNFRNAVLAIGLFVMYALYFLLFLQLKNYFVVIFMIYLLKICLEFVFLSDISKLLQLRQIGYAIIFWQFLYPFYAVLIGILSNKGSYDWKGRKYQH